MWALGVVCNAVHAVCVSSLRNRASRAVSVQPTEQAAASTSVTSPVCIPQQPVPTPEICYPVFVCTHDYDSRTDDDLGFRKGDLMYVISMDNEGWWFARSKDTGREGYIPSNYVVQWDSKCIDGEV